MRSLLTFVFLLASIGLSVGQVSKKGNRLNFIKLKAIRGSNLLDYNLLEKEDGKILIVEFWETWCGPCIQQMPHLSELLKKYPNDLKVVCVSSDDLTKTLNFVKKNSYAFEFVFDPNKLASKVFPHSSIPHTVLIDKNGVVQAETYPGYISETILNEMISGKSVNIPEKVNSTPDLLTPPDSKPSLISFKLSNSELGDRRMSSISSFENKKKIVTGYFQNDYSDTIEIIKEYIQVGNILELYQFAYGKKSEFRFLFSNDLNFIRSNEPNRIYRLAFSISNLFGDFNAVLIRQLNNSFGFETERLKLDTTILVLKSVNLKSGGVQLADANGEKNLNSYKRSDSLHVDGNQIDMIEFAKTIEPCLGVLVEPNNDGGNSYKINISLKTISGTRQEWLDQLAKQGILLSEERRKVEYITIRKALDHQ